MKRKKSSPERRQMHISRLHTGNDQTLMPFRLHPQRLVPAHSYQDFDFQPCNSSRSQSDNETEITDLRRSRNATHHSRPADKINERAVGAECVVDKIELQPLRLLNRAEGFDSEWQTDERLSKPQFTHKVEIHREFDDVPQKHRIPQLPRNNTRHKTMNSGIHSELRRHHTLGCITDVTETETSEHYEAMKTLDVRLSKKPSAKSSKLVSNGLSHKEESIYDAVCENTERTEIDVQKSDGGGTKTKQFEDGDVVFQSKYRKLRRKCGIFAFLFMLVFASSIAGAGLYSIISCSKSRCN